NFLGHGCLLSSNRSISLLGGGAVLTPCCCFFILFLFALCGSGQSGEGGNISFVRPHPSAADFGDSDNCDGKSDRLWIGFGFDSKESAHEIGSLFESKFFSRIDGLTFERNFGESLFISITLCVFELAERNILAKATKARIGTLPLFRLHQDSLRPNNSFLVPVDIKPNTINRRNAGLISSDNVTNQNILQSGVALFNCPTLDSLNGKRECPGHFVFYNARERFWRRVGANLTIYDFSPRWEVIEHGPAVVRFRVLSINIGNDVLAPQKDYLEHCSSGGGFSVGPETTMPLGVTTSATVVAAAYSAKQRAMRSGTAK